MEIKFQEKGYGQGFYDGQMQERKYWQDKIKAKIEEYKELSNNVTMQPQIYSYIVDVLQSLLEKE